MCSGFDRARSPWVAALLLGLWTLPGAATGGELAKMLTIEAVTEVTDVARHRLGRYLSNHGCAVQIRFDDDPGAALAFRLSGRGSQRMAVLAATNRLNQWPRPVWVTRRTAGVRTLTELEGRDLATVAGDDPLASARPLAALARGGVMPVPEHVYEAGDFSSALGLLLHNNTHAAVSEAGFAGQFLDSRDLVVSWAGAEIKSVGWYRGAGWQPSVRLCEKALSSLNRADDRQIFMIFPEWVYGFSETDHL